MAGNQGGNEPSRSEDPNGFIEKAAKFTVSLVFLIVGLGLILWGIHIIWTSPLMDISNAILEGGFCWGGCGFFFLLLFGVSLSMPADAGKVREKRFSLKKAKRIILKRELSKTEERRISIWMSFFFGLSSVIFGIVDLYTSPTGNPFRNLTYSTIKIIFGGLAWVGTGYLCWQQRPLLGGLSFFLLGSSLILLGIMEIPRLCTLQFHHGRDNVGNSAILVLENGMGKSHDERKD